MRPRRPPQRGFTVIEIVVVIVVAGILAAVVALNVTEPVRGLVDVQRRAELVDRAETALARMTREIRLALPNSIRVTGGTTLEFMRTLDGGRYRLQSDGSDNDFCAADTDRLDFTQVRDCFEVLDPVADFAAIDADATDEGDCIAGDSDCLVVYNTGQPGADAWASDNIAGVAAKAIAPDPVNPGVDVVSLTFDRSGLASPFPLQSPAQRFHVVDTPVRFVCDLGPGRLRRVAGYAIDPDPLAPPAGGTSRLLADSVSECDFSFDPGSATRAALVTVSLTLSEEGESVSLLQQVHVPNVP